MSVENMWASASVAQCPNNCNGHGVCNSRGHCHCDMGYSPPHCDYPGPGGSEDSGPASDPNGNIPIKLLNCCRGRFVIGGHQHCVSSQPRKGPRLRAEGEGRRPFESVCL